MSPDIPLHPPATLLDPDPPGDATVRARPGWFLFLGVAQILVGVAAVALAVVTTQLTVLVLGGLALAAAVMEAARIGWARTWQEGAGHAVVGVLYAAFGLVMLGNPETAAATLTLVLAVLLLAGGAARFALAVTGRFRGWGWAAAGGAVAALLGGLIWADWPDNSPWVLGLFVGLDLVAMGAFWVAAALAVGAGQPRRA